MTDCLSVCLSLFINSFYSIQLGDQAFRSHTRREMMSPVKHPLSVTTQSAEETPPQHSNARAGAPTHLECASTTLGSNRCRSFTLNYRRQRRSEGNAHSLLCKRAAWREPEQETPAIIGRKPAVCSFQWCGCRGPLALRERTQLEVQQMCNKSDGRIFTYLKMVKQQKTFCKCDSGKVQLIQ